GTKLDFKGRFYRFDLMTPFFNPGPIEHPRIPVYVAGVNQYMCRIAGEVCDGLHVHPFNSPKYLREYVQPAVNDGLHATGRKREERYAGLLDRTSLSQPWEPGLDDPRLARLVNEFNGGETGGQGGRHG